MWFSFILRTLGIRDNNNNVNSKNNSKSNLEDTSIKLDYIKFHTNESILEEMAKEVKKFGFDIIKVKYLKKFRGAFVVRKNNNYYFLKIMSNRYFEDQEKHTYNILKNKKLKYLLKYENRYETQNYYIYVYEYLSGKALSSYIKNNNLSQKEILKIIKGILLGLDEIHDCLIIHGDIKLQNIFVTDDFKIKIIDYDLSKINNTSENLIQSNNIFGTQQYISPESYHLSIYSKESDIWSTGIIFFFLITNEFPFEEVPDFFDVSSIHRRNIFKQPNFKLLKEKCIEKNLDNKIYNIVKSLLEFKMEYRSPIKDVIEKIDEILL